MAEDTTRLIIQVETLLKGLDKTLRGLGQVETQLKKVASIQVGAKTTTTNLDKAALAAQRLQNQQQRLAIQSQRLAQQQQRVDQVNERLTLSQNRLAAAQQRVARTAGQQADAHVKAFKAIQRGVDDASNHVKFFKANEAALAKAPQLDAHVQAFRRIQESVQAAQQRFIAFGNALRSVGQGLTSLGATLSVAITVPIVALGTASVTAAVRMDSLQRGLKAIVGSGEEASKQLARLTQLAKLPGIGFEEAIQGSIRLQAVGFSALDAEKALRQFANAVALTGGGRDELERITVQLGQLAAKGKVLSQDLRPIIEAAPAVGRALREAFGTVNADDIQALGLSSQQFFDILVDQLTKLPRAAAGARNEFENFRDTVFRAAAAVGEALLPAITAVAQVVGPIITKVAEAFASLPRPVQVAAVAALAFVAAIGPAAFLIGQLVTGIGRAVVGLGQLNQLGFLPAIANLRLLASGALTAAEAEVTLTAATAALGTVLGGVTAILGLIIVAYAAWNAAQSSSVEITQETLDATKDQIDSLKKQIGFVEGLTEGVAKTADEQDRLRQVYSNLNTEAQSRVLGINTEKEQLAALRIELERILQLRLQEREQQIAGITANLANAAARKEVLDKEAAGISDQIARNNQLIAALDNLSKAGGQVTGAFADEVKALQASGKSADDVRLQNLALTKAYNRIQNQLNGGEGEEGIVQALRQYADQLRAVGAVSSDQIRAHLLLAQAIGKFSGDVEATIPILQQFIAQQNAAADAAHRLKGELSDISSDLKKASDVAEGFQKTRQDVIRRNALVARESTLNFQNALKLMNEMIAKDAQLRQAIQRESEIQGKSIEEVVRDALGGGGKRESTLANAQAQLAKQIEDIAKAKSENVLAIQERENERLLAENETAFKAQLRSYEQYLNERARLTIDSLDKEIIVQTEAAIKAQETQREINRQRTKPLSKAQDIKLRIKASEAEERELKALTKAAELETKRNDLVEKLKQAQTEAVLEQERNIRQLAVEYANLQGRVESAFAAESEERSRERLQALSKEQDFIRTRLNLELNGVKVIKGEERARLENKRRLNQQEIEGITNIQRQNDGLTKLVGAEQKVADAKREQSDLEARLDFQVRFRGLSEEAAIQQRLAGEAKLRDALLEAEAITERTIASFGTITPPKALTDALKAFRTALLGLGELDFATKFRLAQKEFDRINDLRILKIQEVERAVAHRDISELQGRIAIKAANGEYVGALEQQLVLLRQIAAESGDAGLLKQAQDAATVTAEVEKATTAVADLNTELKNAAIDEARDAFSGIGRSLVDIARGATTAKEALLDMLDRVAGRLTDIAFDRLSESIFGGLLKGPQAPIAGLTGAASAGVGAGAGAAGLQAAATTAGAALTTGGATAGTAMSTGGVTAGTSIATAAAAFASAVIAAGAAFAAAVAASAGVQAIGSAGGALAGAAATGMFPAVPGGLIHIVEGGHPEAVLSTDPKYATRQASILREYLAKTRGLWGRIPKFEMGGWASASQMESQMLGSLSQNRGFRAPSPSADMQLATPSLNVRNINLIDRGQLVSGHLRSAEGTRDILNIISTERDEVGRRIGVK